MTVPNDFLLAQRTHADIRATQWQVAVLPFGATEPHNLHMPYGTDTFQVDVLVRLACEHAWARGGKVLALPTMPFGVNTNYLQIDGAVACSVTPTTLLALITDLSESMYLQGIQKLVLLNGHGGNELKPLIRQLHHRTKMFHCVVDWYRMGADLAAEIFDAPGEHADEMETSLGLAFFPQWLKPELADKGETIPSRFEAINRGWVSITRPWHLATTNTGLGDPSAASADKGRLYMDRLSERLGAFLAELALSPMDEKFPY
jgi:creatinine amidohydrolase